MNEVTSSAAGDDNGSGTDQQAASFADIFQGFTFRGRPLRRGRQAKREVGPPPDTSRPAAEPPAHDGSAEPEHPAEITGPISEPASEAAGPAAAVRPYAWTGGRTRSSYELRVETLVSAQVEAESGALAQEHRQVLRECQAPRSVAEIAAALTVPLGVARVLLGDTADMGLVTIHHTIAEGAAEQLNVMERVLSGLRRL